MRDGTLGTAARVNWTRADWWAGWMTSRWRQALAATLTLLAGLLFAAVSWVHGVPLPNWMWLALVAVASLAVATQAHDGERQQVSFSESPGQEAAPAAEAPPFQVILAATTHEFRTPLNAIIGYSELLRDAATNGTDSRQRTEYATAVIDNAQTLQHRLTMVLDANRIASGAMVLSEQPCDAAEIIEAVCRDCQARAVTRGITLVARIADGITCRADIHRLRQALAGIVDNAIAFSPGDGIVNVNMLRGTDGGLAISVTDAGPGIADAEAARAFEPFRQVKEGAARPHEGLGLGLYIARGILRLHGGDVSISSSAQSGTDVRIHLPAARVQWTSSAAETETVTVAHVA